MTASGDTTPARAGDDSHPESREEHKNHFSDENEEEDAFVLSCW